VRPEDSTAADRDVTTKGRLVVTSPEGVILLSISFIARVSHCPTADESVVVVWSTLVPNKTSR
jgi:hypothetical protein